MNRLYLVFFYLTLVACNNAVAAVCTPSKNFKPLTVTFTPGDITLNIPRDTPVGTVVYERPFGSVGDSETYNCTANAKIGLIPNPEFSKSATPTRLFEIPGTGLSWELTYSKNGKKVEIYDYDISSVIGSGRYFADSFTFRLIKTGPIPSGSKPINGVLASYNKDEVKLIDFYINATIRYASASCITPDVRVNMGDTHTVTSISNNPAPRVDFDINVLDCPGSVKNILFTLKPNTQIIDQNAGVVALSSESTAKGIALQVFDWDDKPVTFNKLTMFTGNDDDGINYQIPLSASYYRLPTEHVTAGTANSSITFVMTYL